MRNEEEEIRAASCQIPCVQLSTMMILRCLNMCLMCLNIDFERVLLLCYMNMIREIREVL